ncbi:MAG: WhiB family transcriptional regulator [Acidobacteriota bacterium]
MSLVKVLADALGSVTPDWWSHAACRDAEGRNASLFFSRNQAELEIAQSICGSCPARRQCLQSALEDRVDEGVWGGQIFQAGKIVAKRRPRGRPRRVA